MNTPITVKRNYIQRIHRPGSGENSGWTWLAIQRVMQTAHEKDRYSLRYAEFVVPPGNAVQEQQLNMDKYQIEMNICAMKILNWKPVPKPCRSILRLQKQVNELKMVVEKWSRLGEIISQGYFLIHFIFLIISNFTLGIADLNLMVLCKRI